MAVQSVTRVVLAAKYDGSPASAQDVLSACQQITQYSGNIWSIESDDGVTLMLREQNPTYPTLFGLWPVTTSVGWVIVAPDTGIINRLSDAAKVARYGIIDAIITAQVAAMVPAIAASAAVQEAITAQINAKAMYGGFGVAQLPSLIANGTANVDVTIDPAQPDTGYTARAWAISGAAILTTVQITSTTKVSGSVFRVGIRNTGLITLSGVMLVHVAGAVGGASTPSKT